MSLDWITDWQTRLRSRLAEQFKDKPKLVAVVDAFAEQVQALEDSGQALALLGSIDPVTDDTNDPRYWIGRGAQLEVIGRRVGQQHTGEPDAIYRLRLRARIRANRSSGTAEDLYAVFVALFGGAGAAKIARSQPATLIFQVVAMGLDPLSAGVLLDFLRDAKDAGVKLILEWSPVADAGMFTMAGAGGLGFGDSSDPTIGGAFAGAARA